MTVGEWALLVLAVIVVLALVAVYWGADAAMDTLGAVADLFDNET